jgi:hypothetical protein
LNCTRCAAAPALTFDQDTTGYAVPTWSCPACGELHYDARRYNPYKVGGIVYVRRGATNRQAWPAGENADRCDLAPAGWWCTRHKGHEGPCAARPLEPTPDDVAALVHTLHGLREIDRGALEQIATELTLSAAARRTSEAHATALLLLGRVAYVLANEGRHG